MKSQIFKYNSVLRNEGTKKYGMIITVLVMFSFLWFLWFEISKLNRSSAIGKNSVNQNVSTRSLEDSAENCILGNRCIVTCSNFQKPDTLADNLNSLPGIVNCTPIFELIIENCFSEKKLSQGWLNSSSQRVSKLTLQYGINDLGKSAFADYPFEDLIQLSIINSKIKHLKKDFFLGLNSLIYFVFSLYENDFNISAEKEVLEGMKNKLQSLEIKMCLNDFETVHNLVGTNAVQLDQIQKIDFGYNYLKELTDKSFVNAPNVISIYLNNNALEKLDKGTFASLKLFKLLFLPYNRLTTIPNHIFDSNHCNSGKFYLGDNPWNCTCNLQWLKEFNSFSECVDTLNPPKCNGTEPFDDVDFGCDNTTTVPTTTTVQITTTVPTTKTVPTTTIVPTTATLTTTTEYIKYIVISCIESTSHPIFNPENYLHITTMNFKIQNQSIAIDFYDTNEEMFTVAANIFGNISDYHLIWISTIDKSDVGCVTELVQGNTVINNLRRATTYTVSLLKKSEQEISPYNARGLTTPPEWDERTWIENKTIPVVTAIAIIVLLGTAFCAGTTVFCCIRRNPNLLKGNERIIVVDKEKNSVTTSPVVAEDYDLSQLSLYSSNSTNYLSSHIYAKVKYKSPLSGRSMYVSGNDCKGAIYSKARYGNVSRNNFLGSRRFEDIAEVESDSYYEAPLSHSDNYSHLVKSVSNQGYGTQSFA